MESGRPLNRKHHDRLSERHHRLHQFFLPPDQVQAGAVAHVVQSPGFARCLLVAADGQHDHVRSFGHFHGFRDLPSVFLRIAGHDFVLVPVAANGDLAAFAVKHFGAAADLGLDALEHGNVVFRNAAVPAQQAAVSIGSNYRNLLHALQIERHGIALVPEQSYRFASCAARQFSIGIGAHNAVGFVGINIRIVKQPHLKFPIEHGCDKFIQLRFLQHPLAD